MHLLIIGASGLIGGELLGNCLGNNDFDKITLIVRSKINLENQKLNQILIPEFSNEKILNTVLPTDIDIAFCGLGTTIRAAGSKGRFREVDYGFVVAFAKLISKNKVPTLFIVSALGASASSNVFYSKTKGEMERDVSTLSIRNLYFLKPSLLIGERYKKRVGEELGIIFYKSVGRFLPKKIQAFTGTKVVDILEFFKKEILQLKPGIHQVKKW